MSLGAGRVWTIEEDNILLESRRLRERWAIIGKRLDRTAAACCARFALLCRDSSLGTNYGAEAIRRGTQNLGNAIIDAQIRYANRNNMSPEEAQAFLMGGRNTTPSASPFQTCSIERLNSRIHKAATIGEKVSNSNISPEMAA